MIQLYIVGGAVAAGFATVDWMIAIPLAAFGLLAASRKRLGNGVQSSGGSEAAVAVAIFLFGMNSLAMASAAYLVGMGLLLLFSSMF